MKKTIFLTIVVTIINIGVSQCQQYVAFPVDSAKWREYHTQMSTPGSYTWQEIDYFLNGDSVLNSLVYHKLYQSRINGEYYSVGPYGVPYNAIYGGFYNVLIGYIREISKTIYFLEDGQITETILYDFNNLSIGDSVYGQYPIVNIDSIFIDNVYRKRYLISAYTMDSLFLIEGIGYSSGLFPSFNEFENSDDLICFSKNNQIIWMNLYAQSQYPCETILKISNNNLNKYKIYPNPSQGKIYLNTNFNIKSIEITNILGIAIYNNTINNFQNTYEIDLTTIPKGIYFVKLDNGVQIHTEKIIKN